MFSCEFCKISKNTFFQNTWMTTSNTLTMKKDFITMVFGSLLNCVPCVLKTCSRVNLLRAHMPTCLASLRAHVPRCLACLRTHVPTCLACSHAHGQTCLECLPAHVPTYLACLRVHVPTCLACLRAHVPTC